MFALQIIKNCQFFFKSQSIMLGILFDVFPFRFISYFVGSVFQGSRETDIE